MNFLPNTFLTKNAVFKRVLPELNHYISNFESSFQFPFDNSSYIFKSKCQAAVPKTTESLSISEMIIAVGDVHGSFTQLVLPLIMANLIKNVVIDVNEIKFEFSEKTEKAKVIYLGDIFDQSYHDKYYLQVDLLLKVIEKYPNNVVWCYGNHDIDRYIDLIEQIKTDIVHPGSADFSEAERRFYNFTLTQMKTVHYEPSINTLFSHTLILDKTFEAISTGDVEDLLLFSSHSEFKFEGHSSDDHDLEACDLGGESRPIPFKIEFSILMNEISEFNRNVRFLIAQKSVNRRIECKCFNNRCEDVCEDSETELEYPKIFKRNINHVVGHDIVNPSNFKVIMENGNQIVFADFGAMLKKGSLTLTKYYETPRFVIFHKDHDPYILEFPKFVAK